MRRYLIATLIFFASVLPLRGQMERFMMRHQQRDSIEMVYGVNYMIYDPGGLSFYVRDCDSWLLLTSSRNSPIIIEGSYDIMFPDELTIYDGDDASAPSQSFSSWGEVRDTCWSGRALIHFVSDTVDSRQGYELMCYLLCESPTTMFDLDFDSIGARSIRLTWNDSSEAASWTVHYGTNRADLNQEVTVFRPQAELTGLSPYTLYHYNITNSADDNNRHRGCTLKGAVRTNCGGGIAYTTHNIADGPVRLEGVDQECMQHIITGSTDNPLHTVYIAPGFKGTVVLRNLEMTFLNAEDSPIRVAGRDNMSNLDPISKVHFILQGHNTIYNMGGGNACIQVDLGTTAIFSAINPNDHFSGTLCVRQGNDAGGAGIGARNDGFFADEPFDTCFIDTIDYQEGPDHLQRYIYHQSAGGNIGLHNGILFAQGGHGAGIGGSFSRYWNGAILVSGGLLCSLAQFSGAGLGCGSPRGQGYDGSQPPFASVLVLAETKSTAIGAGHPAYVGGRGSTLYPELAVAGSDALYVGDSSQRPVYVRLVKEPHFNLAEPPVRDSVGGLDIYADISHLWRVQENVRLLGDTIALNLNRIYLGTTDPTGFLTIHAALPSGTRLYTDGLSPQGNPYCPMFPEREDHRDSIPWAILGMWHRDNPSLYDTVDMPRLNMTQTNTPDLRLFPRRSHYLLENYSQAESQQVACEVMVVNMPRVPAVPPFNLQVSMRDGAPFTIERWHTDGVTPFDSPMQEGDTMLLRFPILEGQRHATYREQVEFRVPGWTDTTLDQIISQLIVDIDTLRACGGFTILPTGMRVEQDGLYIDSMLIGDPGEDLPRSYTCYGMNFTSEGMRSQRHDSIVAYQVRFAPDIFDTAYAEACDSLLWGGLWRTEEGEHTASFITRDGCDSTVTLFLSLRHSSSWDTFDTLCYLDLPYLFRDTLLLEGTTSGQYVQWEYNKAGCDSAIVLNLTVQTPPPVDFDEPIADCRDKSWTLSALTDGDAISWSSSPFDPSLQGQEGAFTIRVSPSEPTTYTYTATLLGSCDSSTSILLAPVTADLTAAFSASPDTATQAHMEIQLTDLSLGQVSEYTWLANDTPFSHDANPLFAYPVALDSVLISLIVSEETYHCMDTTQHWIYYLRGGELWVPNAFTPQLESNNRFLPKGNNILSYELDLFDRLGRHIYHSSNIHEGWDGTASDGRALPAGAYVYLITYSTADNSNEVHRLKGTVTLIR